MIECIIFFISILFILISIKLLFSINKKYKEILEIKIDKTKEEKELNELQNNIKLLHQEKILLSSQINEQQLRYNDIVNANSLTYENNKAIFDSNLENYKQSLYKACEAYVENLDKNYINAEESYKEKIFKLNQSIDMTKNELNQLKNSLSAGVQAQLRERQKKEQLEFYKLRINKKDFQDILKLEQVKINLSNPLILSKLIWTTYFQKQTSELCNRILGINKVCGIYKITNIETEQCYIGQSVNIADRWKDHIKCGLGIDAPATNKLYNAMQENGIWNFTFELMEECSKEKLNEKEKFWIEMYQSDKFGYNSTKGNK